jgi:CDP-diacylglycerol--serine O-phosphatidyltransferase
MTKFTIPKSAFPNSLTALSLFCGFLSIINANNGELKTAALLIIAAAIFDTLDGIAARLVKVASRFGVELDSLADIVSFGAAPSFLVYKAYLYQFGWYGIVISSLLVILGAFRLARFNVMLTDLETKGDYFTGLPIPLQAITNSFFIISFYRDGKISEPYSYFIFPIVILLAFLMVSNVKYNALPKFTNKSMTERLFLLLIFVLTLVFGIITDGVIIFYLFIVMVIFGILRHIYKKLFVTG